MDLYPSILDNKAFLSVLRKCIGKEEQCLYKIVIHVSKFDEEVAVYRSLYIYEDNS